MMGHELHLARMAVLAAGLALWAGAATAQSPAGAPSWCRIDDPGVVEAERSRRGLGVRDVEQIPCAPAAAAQALPEELILPLPCGRRMLFRRVTLNAAHLLDHHEIFLGTVFEQRAGAEQLARDVAMAGPRSDFLAGAFTKQASGGQMERSYYIGKYEVSGPNFALLQHDLLREDGRMTDAGNPACAPILKMVDEVRGTRVLPAVGVSWFDATRYGEAISAWLIAYDRARIARGEPPVLPWEDGAPGFLRLPTDAEWEFAARGGEAQSATQSQKTYRVKGDDGRPRVAEMGEIASFATVQDPPPDGMEVMYQGRRLPNLLGIFDMVGNAEELAFDLFRALRPDAAVGQAGGVTVLGGNAQQSAEALGVGSRRELPFFSLRGQVRAPVVGFRLVLTAPVFMNARNDKYEELSGNPKRSQQLAAARSELLKSPDGVDRARLRQDLEALKKDNTSQRLSSDQLTQRLGSIQAELDRSNAQLNDRNRRILRQQITTAVLLVNGYDNLNRRLFVADLMIKEEEGRLASLPPDQRRETEARLQPFRGEMRNLRETNEQNFQLYVELLKELAKSSPDLVAAANRDIDREFESRKLIWYQRAKPVVDKHMGEARLNAATLNAARLAAWRDQIRAAMQLR